MNAWTTINEKQFIDGIALDTNHRAPSGIMKPVGKRIQLLVSYIDNINLRVNWEKMDRYAVKDHAIKVLTALRQFG